MEDGSVTDTVQVVFYLEYLSDQEKVDPCEMKETHDHHESDPRLHYYIMPTLPEKIKRWISWKENKQIWKRKNKNLHVVKESNIHVKLAFKHQIKASNKQTR